jgi:membrane protein DedA with SNARE-associated domain/rhodanese-related sulfurtransferase
MPEVLSTILKYGYPSLYVLLFLEAVGFPMPGSLVLLTAGAAAATRLLRPGVSLGIALAAMLSGDTLLYLIGRHTGWALLGFLCRVSMNPESCILSASEAFYKRGRKALLFAKFIPGVNTMAPPLAGSMNMSIPMFLALDLGGAMLYTFTFWIPGFLFSTALKDLARGLQTFGTVVGWIVGIAVAAYLVYRIQAAWRAPRMSDAPPMSPTTVAELLKNKENGDIVIADVRSHGYYDKGATRIRGSVRLDPNSLPQGLSGMPTHKKYFLYCTCYREATSTRVAHLLIEKGYEAYVIVGGLKGWQKAGLPLEPVPQDDMVLMPSFR